APQCPGDNGSPGRFDAVQRLFDNAEHAAGRRGESRWTLGHMSCLLYVLNILHAGKSIGGSASS
ncbi:hypothetical protein KUCAC02_031682, partial [Chaenocephalus aceratus]